MKLHVVKMNAVSKIVTCRSVAWHVIAEIRRGLHFQQNGAPWHTTIQNYLMTLHDASQPGKMSHLSHPGHLCHQLDYVIWNSLKERVYSSGKEDVKLILSCAYLQWLLLRYQIARQKMKHQK